MKTYRGTACISVQFKNLLVLQFILLITCSAKGQVVPPMVKSVQIRGKFVSVSLKNTIDSIMHVGKPFDPLNLSQAYMALRDELTGPEANIAEFSSGAISVLQITSRTKPALGSANGSDAVDVELLPFYLRVDLINIGKNYIAVPHNPYATFWRHASPLLRASQTQFGVSTDKRFGQAIQIQNQTNLRQAFTSAKTPNHAERTDVNLDLDLNKSISKRYNDLAIGLSLDKGKAIGLTKKLGFLLSPIYRHSDLPIGNYRTVNDLLTVLGQIQGSTAIPLFSNYALTSGFSFSKNTTYTALKETIRDKWYHVGITGDQKIGNGVERLNIYFDSHFPNMEAATFQRITANLGYAFVLGKGHSNLDVETMLGGGTIFGTPTPYGEFWAGSANSNFMYESMTFAPDLVKNIQGPLIRSLGQNQGGLGDLNNPIGGTSFWNFNLSIAFPIPRWSRALVPDIAISETPRHFTLAKALKGQVNTVESAIYDNLVNDEGLPDDESTEVKAKSIVDRDIRPAINYLADRANIYSIKPMLLFDLAKLYNDVGPSTSKTWLSGGAGLQLMIVNAKFQAAYMHVLSQEQKGMRSNLLLRLLIENFY